MRTSGRPDGRRVGAPHERPPPASAERIWGRVPGGRRAAREAGRTVSRRTDHGSAGGVPRPPSAQGDSSREGARVEKPSLIVACPVPDGNSWPPIAGTSAREDDNFSQNAPGWRFAGVDLLLGSLEARTPSRWRTAGRRPGRAAAKPSRIRRCCARTARCPTCRRSHLPSGWRRTMPGRAWTSTRIGRTEAVHHAAGAGVALPPSVTRGAGEAQPRDVLADARRASPGRLDLTSVTSSSARCVVLPPAARRGRRARACRRRTSSKGAASCAPASWTENSPST